MRLSGFSQHASSDPQNCKVEPLVISVLMVTSPASSTIDHIAFLGQDWLWGWRVGTEKSVWHRTQHSTTTSSLGIFHPSSRGPARSERALSLSLLSSPSTFPWKLPVPRPKPPFLSRAPRAVQPCTPASAATAALSSRGFLGRARKPGT